MIKWTKKIHRGYAGWNKLRKEDPKQFLELPEFLRTCMFGKWQYYSEEPYFSIIKMEHNLYGRAPWETYDGVDCRRFETLKEAKAYCKEQLKEKELAPFKPKL